MFSCLSAFILLLFSNFISLYACPDETVEGPDKRCYAFFPYHFNHTKSDRVCQIIGGGHLASISNQEVNEFIKTTAQYVFGESKNVWIGGKQDEGKNWLWIDGDYMEYTNWQKDQNTEEKGNHGITIIKSNGKWQSLPEKNILPFVCVVSYRKPITIRELERIIQNKKDWNA